MSALAIKAIPASTAAKSIDPALLKSSRILAGKFRNVAERYRRNPDHLPLVIYRQDKFLIHPGVNIATPNVAYKNGVVPEKVEAELQEVTPLQYFQQYIHPKGSSRILEKMTTDFMVNNFPSKAPKFEEATCITIEDIYTAFNIPCASCMQRYDEDPGVYTGGFDSYVGGAEVTSFRINGLVKEYNLHPSMFYYYCQNLKYNIIYDNNIPVARFATFYGNKYGGLYCANNYHLTVANYVNSKYQASSVYKISDVHIPAPLVKIRNKKYYVAPFPHFDPFAFPLFIYFNKQTEEFRYNSPKPLELTEKEQKDWPLIHNGTYPGHDGWVPVEKV